jgi:hypothetical protein
MADNQWIEFVSKINALTQDRKIEWSMAPSPPDLSPNILVPSPDSVYLANFMGKKLRLYEKPPIFREFKMKNPDGYILEILDSDGSVAWTVPTSRGLEDLYDSVKFQLSGVDKFLKEVLSLK